MPLHMQVQLPARHLQHALGSPFPFPIPGLVHWAPLALAQSAERARTSKCTAICPIQDTGTVKPYTNIDICVWYCALYIHSLVVSLHRGSDVPCDLRTYGTAHRTSPAVCRQGPGVGMVPLPLVNGSTSVSYPRSTIL